MTRCEQKKNEMIPAAEGELAAEGGVAKIEGGEMGFNPVFPDSPVRQPGEFRNDLAKRESEMLVGKATELVAQSGHVSGESDPLDSLPHVVLTNRRGRPAALTPQLQEQLCLLLSVGLSRRQAAAHLGVDHTTLSHTAARDAEFAADLKRSEDVASGLPLLAIFQASKKNWRAAVWLVEHRRQFPPPLTPEEKAAKHQQDLEDAHRQGEVSCALSDGAWGRELQVGKKRRTIVRERSS